MNVLRSLSYRYSPKSIRLNLRAKFTLLVILPAALILSFFVIYDYTDHRAGMMKNLSIMASYNGQLIVESLQSSMQASNFTGMQSIIDTVGQNPRFKSIYLMDLSGKVIFSPEKINAGDQLNSNDRTCMPCHSLAAGSRPSGIVITGADGRQYFRSMVPILNGPGCSQCHDPQKSTIGVMLTDISVAPFDAALKRDLDENLLIGGGSILLTTVIVNLGLNQLVIRRLKRVAEALSSFGRGSRDLILSSNSQDEIGRLEGDFNQMQQRIKLEESSTRHLSAELSRQADQREALLRQLITAQEDERVRVARDLHDELGQALSGLALHTQGIEHLIKKDPERAIKQLATIRGVVEKTTEQIHELILTLRPSALDDLGLVPALRAHGEGLFKDSNITFDLDSSRLGERLPSAIETALYRTCQEALSNIVKHSGAKQVSIRLARQDGYFEGEIIDNGHGFDLNNPADAGRRSRRLGLLGMQERIHQCGGSMEIQSVIGTGTCIKIRIPLSNGSHE